MSQHKPSLKRVIGLGLLTFYGLGTTIGAGIYALLGAITSQAGYLTPFAFLVAALLALFSAFSFSELASRFPRSAGEAVYLREGFRQRWPSTLTGLTVAGIGIISCAALFVGFAAYLDTLLDIPQGVAILIAALLLGSLAAWGIKASVWAAAIITLIEIGGLLLIMGLGITAGRPPVNITQHLSVDGWHTIFGLLSGAYLAFYAMIGFEDMVNIAEEVRDVRRTMRRAIMLTLLITTLLYSTVTLVALSWVTPATLGESDAPLALVFEQITGNDPTIISLIAIFAVINGGLINIVMASRVFYGMSNLGELPRWLGVIHPVRRTPVNAVLLATATITLLALAFPLAGLAHATATLALAVFTLVNLSLVKIKLREKDLALPPEPVAQTAMWVPVSGFIVSAAFLAVELGRLLLD